MADFKQYRVRNPVVKARLSPFGVYTLEGPNGETILVKEEAFEALFAPLAPPAAADSHGHPKE